MQHRESRAVLEETSYILIMKVKTHRNTQMRIQFLHKYFSYERGYDMGRIAYDIADDSVYDYSELRAEIEARYPTAKSFCVAAGMSTRSWSDKTHDVTPWTSSEITRCINALGLSAEDIPRLFFKKKS